MGHARRRPKRLAEKLLRIRTALDISQTEMHRRMDVEDEIPYTRISDYELDKSEPTLTVLLCYARVAGVPMEVLVDDGLDLPKKLPGTTNHEEIRRKFAARGKAK
ncbi:MAG TPA: helix-turn-helix transcriptional regulator [Pyrinomonadaceae bacterium]|nr:helix-turn-helix transcriptional regulator [Pyrinomonadaceae bacterium]